MEGNTRPWAAEEEGAEKPAGGGVGATEEGEGGRQQEAEEWHQEARLNV